MEHADRACRGDPFGKRRLSLSPIRRGQLRGEEPVAGDDGRRTIADPFQREPVMQRLPGPADRGKQQSPPKPRLGICGRKRDRGVEMVERLADSPIRQFLGRHLLVKARPGGRRPFLEATRGHIRGQG